MALVVSTGALLAACGTSYSHAGGTTTTVKPGAKTVLHSADVAGLGTVVVDARGYTVYVLTAGGRQNLPCTDASGCTSAWPPVVVESGHAGVGAGLHGAMLTTTSIGGTTVPLYAGWRLYTFYGDTGPAQSGGQGVQSYGGTWYAITPSGARVTAVTSTTGPMGW
jgi:predicted lipoprotein with Yx(FWY)xxD motif